MNNSQGKKVFYQEIKPTEWVNNTIARGVGSNASDIHIEPGRSNFEVYFRIDGSLRLIESMPITYLNSIINCLKVMAQLDTTEHRRPQDGHFLFQPQTAPQVGSVDLRLSIFPTVSGEAVTIRILNRKDYLFESLEKLGINSDVAGRLRSDVINRSSGMVLVTGLGGSGKSTTLYTILNYLESQKMRQNIITLEDPVELYIPGLRQAQIHPEIDFTFSKGLRSILRQDPNVVMVGEIRDNETAEISIRAALTGTLFFSTMHTINSVGAITRFLEFGLSRSIVSSALLTVIAQRLVRLICLHCKTEEKPDSELLRLIGISKNNKHTFFNGKGCNACGGSGYLGRVGIFEVMFIGQEIRNLILGGASFMEIEEQAKKDGMETLQEAAFRKAIEGITTIEEALRVVPLM